MPFISIPGSPPLPDAKPGGGLLPPPGSNKQKTRKTMKQLLKIVQFSLMLAFVSKKTTSELEAEKGWRLISALRNAFLASINLPANDYEAWLIAKLMVAFDRKQEGIYPKVRFDNIFTFNK
jgi:hypothetical protein